MSEYSEALKSTLAGQPIDPNHQAVVIPDNMHVHDLENLHDAPRRIKQDIELIEVKSFTDYVRRFGDKARTVVKADIRSQRFVAVLDYHETQSVPGWCSHTATYNCPISREWRTWTGRNGKLMAQAEFADFMEANKDAIAPHNGEGPDSTQMLEVSRNVRATQKVEFKSSINLSNGDTQFEYQQKTDGTTGAAKGKIDVPSEFWLQVPVYEGDDAYAIKARLRYRIKEGMLVMWYELINPDVIAEDAFRHTLETIDAQAEGHAVVFRAAT